LGVPGARRLVVVTVPLSAFEAYHAAVTAAIDAAERSTLDSGSYRSLFDLHRAVADRALARLRRHAQCNARINGKWTNDCRASAHLSCPDALDAWADLTDIGTTYGVKT
jgi:hypothetical protein